MEDGGRRTTLATLDERDHGPAHARAPGETIEREPALRAQTPQARRKPGVYFRKSMFHYARVQLQYIGIKPSTLDPW